jgi:HEAT repeat protein
VHNLAAEPAHAEDLARLRALLRREMLAAGDLGLLPEGEMRRRAAGRTPYELATDPAGNPLPELLRAADLAGARDPRHLAELSALLRSPDAALRWWGATGLLALRAAAGEARPALTAAFQDPSPDVRLAVAEALARLGPIEPVLPVFRAALQAPDAATRLVALVAAGRLGRAAAPLVPDIRGAALKDPAQPDAAEYVGRMVEYLPGRLAP